MKPFHVRVVGHPKGQPRARAFAKNGKVRMYDPSTAEGWKNAIAMEMVRILPASPYGVRIAANGDRVPMPVSISATFLFDRPKYLFRKSSPESRIPYLAKPDRDNLDKAVLDALVAMRFLADDAVVFDGHLEKWYVAKGEDPGLILTINIYEEQDL